MTPIDIKALRNIAIADGHDAETLEFIDDLYTMAPVKTCEGMLAMGLNYDNESFTLLVRLLKKAIPRRTSTQLPDPVVIDEWSILFAPGDLHVSGNLPVENNQIIVLGDLRVDGVIGSYRDFELSRVVVMGDLTAAGIEGDKTIHVEGLLAADIIHLEGETGEVVADAIEARVLYSGKESAIRANTVHAEHRFSARRPVDQEAMQSVLAPEAFVPEPGYVFESHRNYGCVNRALRLMQLGRPGLLHH